MPLNRPREMTSVDVPDVVSDDLCKIAMPKRSRGIASAAIAKRTTTSSTTSPWVSNGPSTRSFPFGRRAILSNLGSHQATVLPSRKRLMGDFKEGLDDTTLAADGLTFAARTVRCARACSTATQLPFSS